MKKIAKKKSATEDKKTGKSKLAFLIVLGDGILAVLAVLLAAVGVLSATALKWLFHTWSDLKIDQIIYQINAPIEGTNGDMIKDALVYILTPVGVAVVLVAGILCFFILRMKQYYEWTAAIFCVTGLAMAVFCLHYGWNKLEVQAYMDNKGQQAMIIDEHYRNPSNVNLTFPETKRNLIYIVLESMETTYADEASGGAFEKNVIPELTQIAMENEDFSGSDPLLNGEITMNGMSWTIASLFAQTSGLPLIIPVEPNSMSEQKTFFPQLTGIGDILEEQGYHQVFMIGSDATFGGRRNYFRDHGNYEIMDWPYFKQTGAIPEDYSVFWGMEDEKLFAFAKEKLLSLSKEERPFNFTMLTVDTHFEDGYLGRLCRDDFPGNQYANVMACSSRQVKDFVDWIKGQDFYENTTIIIQGDHETMDSDFCEDVPDSFQRRTLTAYINAPVSPVVEEKRQYSALDSFPTTLAAVGVQIEGEELGLGVNLFSNHKTLVERYGADVLNTEFMKKSEVMEQLYTSLE